MAINIKEIRDKDIEHRGLKVLVLIAFVLLAGWVLAKADYAVHEQYRGNEWLMTLFYAALVVATGLFYDVAKSCLSESSHPPVFGLLAVSLFGWGSVEVAIHEYLWAFFVLMPLCAAAAVWTYRHFHGEQGAQSAALSETGQ